MDLLLVILVCAVLIVFVSMLAAAYNKPSLHEEALTGSQYSPGSRQIMVERYHQIQRGYTAEHDDRRPSGMTLMQKVRKILNGPVTTDDLVKAGALIAAEIDRRDRYLFNNHSGLRAGQLRAQERMTPARVPPSADARTGPQAGSGDPGNMPYSFTENEKSQRSTPTVPFTNERNNA